MSVHPTHLHFLAKPFFLWLHLSFGRLSHSVLFIPSNFFVKRLGVFWRKKDLEKGLVPPRRRPTRWKVQNKNVEKNVKARN